MGAAHSRLHFFVCFLAATLLTKKKKRNRRVDLKKRLPFEPTSSYRLCLEQATKLSTRRPIGTVLPSVWIRLRTFPSSFEPGVFVVAGGTQAGDGRGGGGGVGNGRGDVVEDGRGGVEDGGDGGDGVEVGRGGGDGEGNGRGEGNGVEDGIEGVKDDGGDGVGSGRRVANGEDINERGKNNEMEKNVNVEESMTEEDILVQSHTGRGNESLIMPILSSTPGLTTPTSGKASVEVVGISMDSFTSLVSLRCLMHNER